MAPEDPAQLDHERRIRRLEEARVTIEDACLSIVELRRSCNDEHERWKIRMEQVLAEISERLNRLIGWADGTVHPPKPPDEPPHQQP